MLRVSFGSIAIIAILSASCKSAPASGPGLASTVHRPVPSQALGALVVTSIARLPKFADRPALCLAYPPVPATRHAMERMSIFPDKPIRDLDSAAIAHVAREYEGAFPLSACRNPPNDFWRPPAAVETTYRWAVVVLVLEPIAINDSTVRGDVDLGGFSHPVFESCEVHRRGAQWVPGRCWDIADSLIFTPTPPSRRPPHN